MKIGFIKEPNYLHVLLKMNKFKLPNAILKEFRQEISEESSSYSDKKSNNF